MLSINIIFVAVLFGQIDIGTMGMERVPPNKKKEMDEGIENSTLLNSHSSKAMTSATNTNPSSSHISDIVDAREMIDAKSEKINDPAKNWHHKIQIKNDDNNIRPECIKKPLLKCSGIECIQIKGKEEDIPKELLEHFNKFHFEHVRGNKEKNKGAPKKDDEKIYKEASAAVKKASGKVLELLLKLSTGQVKSEDKTMEIFVEILAPFAQMAGPYGAVIMGVLKGFIPHEDPVMKLIAKLDTKIEEYYIQLNSHLDQILKELKAVHLKTHYIEKVICSITEQKRFYTDTILLDPDGMEKFIKICEGGMNSYKKLNYMMAILGISEHTTEFDDVYMQNVMYEIDPKRATTIKTAMMMATHALQLAKMGTFCASITGPEPDTYMIKILLEQVDQIIKHLASFIPNKMGEAWPEIFEENAIRKGIISVIGKTRVEIMESELSIIANKIQSEAYKYGADSYKYQVIVTKHCDQCFWQWKTDYEKEHESLYIFKYNYKGADILLARMAFSDHGNSELLNALPEQNFYDQFYAHCKNNYDNEPIFRSMDQILPKPSITGFFLLTNQFYLPYSEPECPVAFGADADYDASIKYAYIYKKFDRKTGYNDKLTKSHLMFLFFPTVLHFERPFKYVLNKDLLSLKTLNIGAQMRANDANFEINLLDPNGNVVMHFNPRYDNLEKNVAVLNSRHHNQWGNEERCPLNFPENFELEFNFYYNSEEILVYLIDKKEGQNQKQECAFKIRNFNSQGLIHLDKLIIFGRLKLDYAFNTELGNGTEYQLI